MKVRNAKYMPDILFIEKNFMKKDFLNTSIEWDLVLTLKATKIVKLKTVT